MTLRKTASQSFWYHSIWKWLGWFVIAVFAILFFGFFCDIPQDSDVGCFSAVAHSLKQGRTLYLNIFDNKAPGIFFLHRFFQWITQGSYQYFALLQTSFMVLFLASVWRTTQQFGVYGILFLPALGCSIMAVSTSWGFAYTGGFTEEIGFYVLATSLVWAISSDNRKWKHWISGLLFVLAFLIKEPFLVFLPVFLVCYCCRDDQWKGLFHWVLGGLVFVLGMVGYLWISGALEAYVYHYFAFASAYAKAGDSPVGLRFFEGWNRFIEWVQQSQNAWVAWIIPLVLIPAINKQHRPFLKIWMMLLLGWICSTGFWILGEQVYGHYFLPSLYLWQLLVLWTVFLLGNASIRAFPSAKWGVVAIGIFIVWGYSKDIIREMSHPNHQHTAKLEAQLLQSWKTPETVFVNNQSLGRLYYLMDAKHPYTFSVPYWVYFDGKSNEKLEAFAQDHRQLHDRELHENPPVFILQKKNKIDFEGYVLKDSLNLPSTGWIYRFKRFAH